MSLQLRRGTNAERLAMTPAVGEIIYTTDTKKVWTGDGATVGGIEVGSTAPVDSVAGKTGAVTLVKADITDFVATDYATGAEGDLATSATQPADAISTLTNDSGYITGYTVTQGDVTAHQAALSLTESQISDLGAYITGITGESIKNLSDVFTTMVPTDGQVLTYDTTNGWQAETQAAIPSAFTDLTDTVAYTGAALQVVRVNAGETALEYVAAATPALPTTTKGDLIVHNGTTDVREAIGTNDQVLTADSTQASGMKWADAAGGGDNWLWVNNGNNVGTVPRGTGVNNIALGNGAVSGSGAYAIAIGQTSKVQDNGVQSIAIGAYSNAGIESTSVGQGAGSSSADYVTALGYGSTVTTNHTIYIKAGTSAIKNEVGKHTIVGTSAQYVLPSYATGSRPTGTTGGMVFDTTLGKPIWYDGTNWVDATGTTV